MNAPEGISSPLPRVLLGLVLLMSAGLLVLDVLPVLAPGEWGSAARLALATTCHQQPERAFAWQGIPLAACARCVGLHAGGIPAALLALGLGASLARQARVFRWAIAASAVLLASDVAAGVLLGSWNHPVLRAVTGLLFAASVLSWALATLSASHEPSGSAPKGMRTEHVGGMPPCADGGLA